jgi:hypothetical protein
MTREVHEIPPAPRRVRWSAALWHRWPLAFLGFVLAVYGGLIGVMLNYSDTGGLSRTDRLLDAGARTAPAVVLRIEETSARFDSRPAVKVFFSYAEQSGQRSLGECFAAAGMFQADGSAVAEYLSVEHSRLRGGRATLARVSGLLQTWLLLVVLPGATCLLLWAGGVLRLRQVLGNGDVAVAELQSLRRLPWLLPTMLAVEFEFRDRSAARCRGRHWVRAHSALGRRLAAGPAHAAVVHDRVRPRRCRLVLADDFLVREGGERPPLSREPSRR